MKEKSLFEQLGGTYSQVGDYLLPNLTLPEQGSKPIGLWGRKCLHYIKQHRKLLYTNLLTSCKLVGYLADIDERAESMFTRLVGQMARQENVTETLKAENQMLWVRKMNNIQARSRKIANSELIFI